MTRVKACEEKTPDRSSIFAGFSNPRASTNHNRGRTRAALIFRTKIAGAAYSLDE